MRIPSAVARAARARAARAVILAAAVCAVAACGGGQANGPDRVPPGSASISPHPASGGSSGASTGQGVSGGPGSYPAAAWPEFNRNAARTGVAPSLPAAGRLGIGWRAHLDGAVYGQPLLIGDLVIAATENDTVYALSNSTGKMVWSRHVGTPVPLSSLPCGNIDPLGITGTPVYDQGSGLVYALAEISGYRHVLFGLTVADGAVKVQRYIPAPDGHERYDQQRPALAITGGRVYVAFGGLAGDCGPYIGSVVGVPLSGKGDLISFRTPTSREGAVWGTAGPVVGPDGDLWVAIGNGEATGGAYDGSDSAARLDPSLRRVSFFAPDTWADDNANDLDLGSTQPVLTAGNSALITGKRGVSYLLNTLSLGGIGGEVAQKPVCAAFGAAAVDGSTVFLPCSAGGMTALSVSAAQRKIQVLWRGPASANGSPVVGGGAVWVTDWNAGMLYELSHFDGKVLEKISLGASLPHFSSLSLAGGAAYVSTMDGVIAVSGA
jgi:outer membrane protein assembly factor BamB